MRFGCHWAALTVSTAVAGGQAEPDPQVGSGEPCARKLWSVPGPWKWQEQDILWQLCQI